MISNNFLKQILLLPIYKSKEELIDRLKNENSNILILVGETGSGKTTQVPKIIYQNFDLQDKMICITQPRRIAAISISHRVAEELNSKIGETVGYSVRFKEKMSNKTKIKFVTDGMLVRECILDQNLSKYKYIILDEVHERSIHTDILMMICKDLIINQKRKDLKLIIMSATLNPQKYMDYFKTDNILQIHGRTFPVKVFNIKADENNIGQSDKKKLDTKDDDNIINNNDYDLISLYIDRCLNCILQIILSEDEDKKEGDILVFLPGQEDIEDLHELLLNKKELISSELPEKKIDFKILPLFGSLPSNQQMQIFRPIKNKLGKNIRKIILSTNIAETSLTIKNIKFIIDSGFFKMRKFYPKLSIDTLKINKISKNSALQRTGRTGREAPGYCYRLYSNSEYDKFPENSEPEIQRINLRNISLQLFSIGYSDFINLDFMDKPPKENFYNAFEDLISFGAIENESYKITEFGKNMSILPMDPLYSIILINSLKNEYTEVFEDIVSIISVLQSDNIFYTPSSKKEIIEKIREKFIDITSDHLTLRNIFKEFKNSDDKETFCKENYLNDKALSKALEIFKQLIGYLKKLKLNEYKDDQEKEINDKIEQMDKYLNSIKNIGIDNNENKNDLIINCLLTGYFNNIGKYSNDNFYTTNKGNLLCKIHPTSVLIKKPRLGKQYEYMIFNEMIITSKKYLKCCTLVTNKQVEKYLKKNKNII